MPTELLIYTKSVLCCHRQLEVISAVLYKFACLSSPSLFTASCIAPVHDCKNKHSVQFSSWGCFSLLCSRFWGCHPTLQKTPEEVTGVAYMYIHVCGQKDYCLSCTFDALTPCSLNSISLLPFANCLHSKKKHMFGCSFSCYTYFLIISMFLVTFQAFYPMDRTYDIKKGDILVSEIKHWFYLIFYFTSTISSIIFFWLIHSVMCFFHFRLLVVHMIQEVIIYMVLFTWGKCVTYMQMKMKVSTDSERDCQTSI